MLISGFRARSLKRTVLLLCTASIFLLPSCSHKGGTVRRHGKGSLEMRIPMPGNLSHTQRRLLAEAESWMGTPYRYAGQEKGKGTDCSGMVMAVYETVTGCKLPRNSAKQAEFCKNLKPRDVAPGDLVFFATGKDPDKVSHVGIMLDNDRFIHASTSKGVVVSNVSAPYYTRTFMMFGRVPGVSLSQ